VGFYLSLGAENASIADILVTFVKIQQVDLRRRFEGLPCVVEKLKHRVRLRLSFKKIPMMQGI